MFYKNIKLFPASWAWVHCSDSYFPKLTHIICGYPSFDDNRIILDEMDTNLYLSSRNIPHVEVVTVKEINPGI